MFTKKTILAQLILLAVVIVLINIPALAQWENLSVEMVTEDGGRKNSSFQSIDLDNSGNPHIAWLQVIVGVGNKVMYVSRNSSGEWGYIRTLADTTFNPSSPSLAVSPVDNEAYIVYTSDNNIYISYLDGMMWGRQQVSQIYEDNSSPTIAVDDSGYIHIAWIVWDDDLQEYHIAYTWGNIGNWQEQMLADSYLGQWGSGAAPYIDVTSDGVAHIVYRGGTYGFYHVHHAWNSEAGGEQWQYETVYSNNANDFSGMLTIDSENGLHLAMSGSNGYGFPNRVMYRYKSPDGIWTDTEPLSETLSLTEPSLALDIYDRPHINAMEVSGNMQTGAIYYAYKDGGGTWQCDSLYGNDHFNPCLKLDDANTGKMFCYSGGNTGVYDIYYLTGDITTSIDDSHDFDRTARSYELMQNYPNPFNDATIIRFNLSHPGQVQLDIYNILGEKVANLCDSYRSAGSHEVMWNTAGFSSGVYLYQLRFDGMTVNKKAMLLK